MGKVTWIVEAAKFIYLLSDQKLKLTFLEESRWSLLQLVLPTLNAPNMIFNEQVIVQQSVAIGTGVGKDHVSHEGAKLLIPRELLFSTIVKYFEWLKSSRCSCGASRIRLFRVLSLIGKSTKLGNYRAINLALASSNQTGNAIQIRSFASPKKYYIYLFTI